MENYIKNNIENNIEMTYEKAMDRLSEIVKRLESGDISLDEGMKLFEEGTGLASFCSKQLEEAHQKISILTKDKE